MNANNDNHQTCSICHDAIEPVGIPPKQWFGGHNAEPVNNGRCCTRCNDRVVIPARLKIIVSMAKRTSLMK